MQDEVEYLGIQYFCNGSICGNWWNGNFKDFAPRMQYLNLVKMVQ
jgi:hypothetical protein